MLFLQPDWIGLADFIIFGGRNRKDRSNNNHNENVKKNVLLVDDEPDITFSIKEELEDAGFNVDMFNDSMHALENFKPDFYDLAILDIVMPGMGGFDLCLGLLKFSPDHREVENMKRKILVVDDEPDLIFVFQKG